MTNALRLIKDLEESIKLNKPTNEILVLLKQIEIDILSSQSNSFSNDASDVRQYISLLNREMQNNFNMLKDELYVLKKQVLNNNNITIEPANQFEIGLEGKNNPETRPVIEPSPSHDPKPENTKPAIKDIKQEKEYKYFDAKMNYRNDVYSNSVSIDLNQKILFTQKLFKGSTTDFTNFIERVFKLRTKNEAENMIKETFDSTIIDGSEKKILADFQKWILSKFKE